jgi:hypothetical protein
MGDMSVMILRTPGFGKSKKNASNELFFVFWFHEKQINLLVILFLLLVHGGLGDTVQITLTTLSDPSATLLLVNLNDTNLLKGLEHSAVDLARGVDVVGGGRTAVLRRSVDLAETANTDGLAEVDVTGDGGGTNVEPDERIY